MDGGDKLRHGEIWDRLKRLEASHLKLKKQFKTFLQDNISHNSGGSSKNYEERKMASDSGNMTSLPGWGNFGAAYFAESPYRNVLEYIGHAVHVTRVDSGNIVFWNPAAEKLFGYKESEVLGYVDVDLLFNEEYHQAAMKIKMMISTGESWSGQLPLKKRSGQTFMAIVSKSPLYENGKLTGDVTVSHDSTIFNSTYSGNNTKNHANEQPRGRGINLNKFQWNSSPQIAVVPHIASSVSNLASKVLQRNGNVTTRQGDEADRPPRAPNQNSTLQQCNQREFKGNKVISLKNI